jgi:hypothetical protein
MEVSKIQLSKAETDLMLNAEIILTKNRVLEKMKALLEEVMEKQLLYKNEHLPQHEAFLISPKISRGENYLGLPWLILDYPRTSLGNNLFFIRSMFWWGKFFSSTLHISGDFKKSFSERIRNSMAALPQHFIGINEDPWVHHFEPDNYRSIGSISEREFDRLANNMEHLKIGISFPLQEWERAPVKLFENWKFYLQLTGLVADAV